MFDGKVAEERKKFEDWRKENVEEEEWHIKVMESKRACQASVESAVRANYENRRISRSNRIETLYSAAGTAKTKSAIFSIHQEIEKLMREAHEDHRCFSNKTLGNRHVEPFISKADLSVFFVPAQEFLEDSIYSQLFPDNDSDSDSDSENDSASDDSDDGYERNADVQN